MTQVAEAPVTSSSALPAGWRGLWGEPSPFYLSQIAELRSKLEGLAVGLGLVDMRHPFLPLVGALDNYSEPVHRWYAYKEAFSFKLPGEVVDRLGAGKSGFVVDVFGGVGTTALALRSHLSVKKVVSVEYNLFAHLAGKAKLAWASLNVDRLRLYRRRLLAYRRASRASVPDLAAFANSEIFEPSVVKDLVSAREAIRRAQLQDDERQFFLLGLAAIVEDVSNVMKDGRALRILRGRQRRMTSLIPDHDWRTTGDPVRDALANQWQAMIEDVELLQARPTAHAAEVHHIKGDARDLPSVQLPDGSTGIPAGAVGLFIYSPPYLNFTDYTEVYKLELWLLQLVQTQEAFRHIRLGTLRSHPSIEFPDLPWPSDVKDLPVVEAVEAISRFAEAQSLRSNIGRTIRRYFQDMHHALRAQYRALEPGGTVACVVANSTFSRRDKGPDGAVEVWRIPLLTDVILARLGEALGFEQPEVWAARTLVPRNVARGAARESIVVLRKPRKKSGHARARARTRQVARR